LIYLTFVFTKQTLKMCVCVLQKYSFVCPVQNHLPSVPENVRSSKIAIKQKSLIIFLCICVVVTVKLINCTVVDILLDWVTE